MTYQGSCHCGGIAFTLEGEVGDVIDCNCSMCRRKGALLAAFPRSALTLTTPESDLRTYQFNKHLIDHHFCANCGISPYSEGTNRKGEKSVMVNVRCLPEVDLTTLKVMPFDGASY